jgi:hypothetical protein
MRLILTLILIVIANFNNDSVSNKIVLNPGQSDKNNDDNWGIGIISNMKLNESEIINFPSHDIYVYNKPNGIKIGKILKINSDEYYKIYFDDFVNKKRLRVSLDDLVEINYEGTCLKYYEKTDNYIKCLNNLIDGGVWINTKDLKIYGFSDLDWRNFLIQTDRCYFPINNNGLLIFDSDGNVIDTLKKNLNVLKLINAYQNGLVKVNIYNLDECGSCGEKLIKTGWMKIIDDNGSPLIYFYTRGC